MAIPQNQIPANAQEAVLNLARTLGVEIEIKGAQDKEEVKHHKPRKLPKVLYPKMIERLFAKINMDHKVGPRNRAMFETMLKGGLRVSEVCNLVPANIDFEEKIIHVQNGKGGVDRNIPMRASLREWLEEWAELRPQHAQYFFCTLKGTRILPRYCNRVLQDLSELSGVYLQDGLEKVPVSCHKLRHTCATNWLREGFNLPQIQRLLGHKNINTTMIYISVGVEDLKEKMFALEESYVSKSH